MEQNIKKLLGCRIKELRNSQNITQQQLAEMIDIDQRSLSAIECGTNFPTRSLLKIANALNVNLKDLFDYEHLELDKTEKIQVIARLLENISPRDLDIIYRLIKSMV